MVVVLGLAAAKADVAALDVEAVVAVARAAVAVWAVAPVGLARREAPEVARRED
jgi:hypothetical protein